MRTLVVTALVVGAQSFQAPAAVARYQCTRTVNNIQCSSSNSAGLRKRDKVARAFSRTLFWRSKDGGKAQGTVEGLDAPSSSPGIRLGALRAQGAETVARREAMSEACADKLSALRAVPRIRTIPAPSPAPPVENLQSLPLRLVFQEFDTNNNGFIDVDEMESALIKAGKQVSKAECEAILAKVDKNGDGQMCVPPQRSVNARAYVSITHPPCLARSLPPTLSLCLSSFEEFQSVFKRRSNPVPLSKEGFLAACRTIYSKRFSANKGSQNAEAVPDRWRRGWPGKKDSQPSSPPAVPAARLRAAFDDMDADGNGFIEMSELEAALNSVGRCEGDECELIFMDVDENSDGKISFEGERARALSRNSVLGFRASAARTHDFHRAPIPFVPGSLQSLRTSSSVLSCCPPPSLT